MRSTYKIVNENYPYFITSTIVNWLNIFTSESYFEIMMNNFIFYQNKYKIEIIAYVIMPNHFHMVCNFKELRKAIQSLKSFTSKELLNLLEYNNNETVLTEHAKKKLSIKLNQITRFGRKGIFLNR